MSQKKFLDQAGLQIVWSTIKAKFVDNDELVQELLNYEAKAELSADVNDILDESFEDGSLKEILTQYESKVELVEALASYVQKEIISTDGTALLFNEVDGGGAKFEAADGTASFAGVNSDTNGGIGAQLYDIDVASNEGSKLDVTINGIYYTTGDDSALPASQRDVEANEIATKKDIESITYPEYSMTKESDPGDYAAVYHLTKDGVNIGEAINIAKDQLLKSVEVKTCTVKDVPIEGLNVGDKYIDFTFIVEDGAESHSYIAIKDMVKPYTAGEGIVITTENEITYDPDVLSTVDFVDASISDTMNFIIQERDAEHAGRVAGDNLLQAAKVDKEISSANGKARIFNEADGGGAKFEHTDGSEAYVGVNDGGKDGMMAQIYADVLKNGKWSGSRINVYNDKIYYTSQADVDAGVERNDSEHEIATLKDVAEAEPDTMTRQDIEDICK